LVAPRWVDLPIYWANTAVCATATGHDHAGREAFYPFRNRCRKFAVREMTATVIGAETARCDDEMPARQGVNTRLLGK
jgi:hypothetical protein